MKKKLFDFQTVPRWVILLIDILIIGWSFSLSYFILKHFEFPAIYRGHFFMYTGLYCLISLFVFYFMRIHSTVVRYSTNKNISRIFAAVLIISFIYPVGTELLVSGYFRIHSLDVRKVLLINFFISTSFLILFRTAVREIFEYVKRITAENKERVLIYGSNGNSIAVKQALETNNDPFIILGFIETKGKKTPGYIEHKKVFHIQDLGKLKGKYHLDKLLLIDAEPDNEDKKVILDACIRLEIEIVKLPPVDQWIYGRFG